MFTLQDIHSAHARVQSGADFPAYIQALIRLGVSHYETFGADGHAVYFGTMGNQVASPAQYESIAVAGRPSRNQFLADLKRHQNGESDYMTFCSDAARSGVEKWTVFLDEMTCTYFDNSGKEILVEVIPG